MIQQEILFLISMRDHTLSKQNNHCGYFVLFCSTLKITMVDNVLHTRSTDTVICHESHG